VWLKLAGGAQRQARPESGFSARVKRDGLRGHEGYGR